MADLSFDAKQRKGSSGRVSNQKMKEGYKKYAKCDISFPPEIFDRLEKFCADEERARSWVCQKAVDFYLQSKGY